MLADAIDDVKRGLMGQFGSTISPDAPYEGGTVRQLLQALQTEINTFLA